MLFPIALDFCPLPSGLDRASSIHIHSQLDLWIPIYDQLPCQPLSSAQAHPTIPRQSLHLEQNPCAQTICLAQRFILPAFHRCSYNPSRNPDHSTRNVVLTKHGSVIRLPPTPAQPSSPLVLPQSQRPAPDTLRRRSFRCPRLSSRLQRALYPQSSIRPFLNLHSSRPNRPFPESSVHILHACANVSASLISFRIASFAARNRPSWWQPLLIRFTSPR